MRTRILHTKGLKQKLSEVGLRVLGLLLWVEDTSVQGLRVWVKGLGLRLPCVMLRGEGLGFRVWGRGGVCRLLALYRHAVDTKDPALS